MIIQMSQTRRGSENGFTTRVYEQGKTYDIADILARAFIRSGWAVEPKEVGIVTDTSSKPLETRRDELFTVLAKLSNGMRDGNITTLAQVREAIAPAFMYERD